MATRRRLDSATELSKLSSSESGDGYDFKRLTYPSDNLGTDEIPSYVMFYINLPETSQLKSKNKRVRQSTSDEYSASTRGRSTVFSPIGEGDFGDIAAATAIITTAKDGISTVDDVLNKARDSTIAPLISTLGSGIEKKPKFFRIARAIALYMPDTVFQTYTHDYDALSVTQATGVTGMAQRGAGVLNQGGETSLDNIKNYVTGGSAAGKELGGFVAEQTGLVGQGFTDLVLRSSGLALNPQIEMVYKQTQNRQFTFDFRMQPRDSAESNIIKNIIRYFKMYSAPALTDGAGAYFEIPGQFDIEFMFKNEENKFIGKISTCVLQNIDVNYSSAGQFATFSDGSPVEINLQLRFIEVDTLTRQMFDRYNNDTIYDNMASF
jgi:hypothetical protein